MGIMKKSISIICDGTEIAYGMNLLHLIKYEGEKVFLKCKRYKDCATEIYTVKSFERAEKILNNVCVYFGKAGNIVGKPKFQKYGISIWEKEKVIVCKADVGNLGDEEYVGFLNYANELRKKYMDIEKEYVSAVLDCNLKWIVQEFIPINSGGMFGWNSKKKDRLLQLYDCSAFIVFDEMMDIID